MADAAIPFQPVTLTDEQKAQIGETRPMAEQALKQLDVLERAGIPVDTMRQRLNDGIALIDGLRNPDPL